MNFSDRSRWKEVDQLRAGSRAVEETRVDADTPCARCQWGHLYRRRHSVQFEVFCSYLERHVPADIVECSKFTDAKTLSLSDMVSIAIPVDSRIGVDERSYR